MSNVMNDLECTSINDTHYKNKGLSILGIIVILIVSLRFCYPLNALLGDTFGYVIYYGLYISFLFMAVLSVNGYLREFINDLWIVFAFLLTIIVRSLLAGRLGFDFWDPLKMTLNITNIIVAYSLYLYIKRIGTENQKKIVITALISLVISGLFSLYYILFVDELAVRNAQLDKYFGVGDFNLLYTVVFLQVICVAALTHKRELKKRTKFVLMLTVVVSTFLVLKADFMTALILFLFSSVLTYILFKKRKLVIPVIFLALLTFFLSRGTIGLFFISFSYNDLFSWVINDKLRAIGNILIGNMTDLDTLDNRMLKITYSIESFKTSPFFGLDFNNYNEYTIGGHAQWFDDLARFGLFGCLMWIFFYRNIYIKIINETKSDLSKYAVISSWILFVLLGFLNPNNMSILTSLFFAVIPFSGVLLDNNNKKNLEKQKL